MITSLTGMLELANFGHITTSAILNFAGDVMDKNYDVINVFSKYLSFKKA